MVQWQHDRGFKTFQLPEPFCGDTSDLNLAFMGLNPSISQSKSIPKANSEQSFEDFDNFYRERLSKVKRDSDGQIPTDQKLWRAIERFGNTYLSDLTEDKFVLGKNTALIEAVRYKSTDGELGVGKQRTHLLEHQRPFTTALLEDSGFRIVVPMGREAISEVNQLLQFTKPIPSNVRDAMGNLYVGTSKNGATVYVCPIKHMSFGIKKECTSAVGKQILRAHELMIKSGDLPLVA